jgi:hypothetical protein
MDGAWTEHVTAQVMITLRRPGASLASLSAMSKIFDIFVHADGLAGDASGQAGASEYGEVDGVLSLGRFTQRDLTASDCTRAAIAYLVDA